MRSMKTQARLFSKSRQNSRDANSQLQGQGGEVTGVHITAAVDEGAPPSMRFLDSPTLQ